MIKLYTNLSNGKTILQLWGASTKHPDSTFYFEDFEQSPYAVKDSPTQIFQWLLEIASKMTFSFHAYEIADFAMKSYQAWLQEG